MSKFFDPRTCIVHSAVSYVGAAKIPKDIVEASIKIREGSDVPLEEVKLRRCGASHHLFKVPSYFSAKDHRIYEGTYTLDLDSNDDLIPIQSTIIYK